MGLYKYEVHQDTSLLKSNQTPTREDESLPVLWVLRSCIIIVIVIIIIIIIIIIIYPLTTRSLGHHR